MADRLPLVGITIGSRKFDSGPQAWSVRSTYTQAVAAGRGAPILIPVCTEEALLRSIYERLDGILLSGGGDVAPKLYGAESSVYTDGVDPDRDEVEIQLVHWAVEGNKPLLAICRGIQVLNVALGGTLIQDIREEAKGALRHDAPSEAWFPRLTHPVTLAPGSELQAALGTDTDQLSVNSLHHQAVGRIADDLEVVAWASDGIVEGVQVPGQRFALGVQWHPETLFQDHPPMLRLFESFVEAAQP